MLFLGLLCQRGIGIKWEPGGDSVGFLCEGSGPGDAQWPRAGSGLPSGAGIVAAASCHNAVMTGCQGAPPRPGRGEEPLASLSAAWAL